MKETSSTPLQEGLLDIALPSMPPASLWPEIFLWLGLLFVALLVIALVVFRIRTTRMQNKRKLAWLRKQVTTQNMHFRTIAYELAALVSKSLHANRICISSPNPVSLENRISNENSWEQYIQQLSTARYSPKPPSATELNDLINQTEFWMKQIQ